MKIIQSFSEVNCTKLLLELEDGNIIENCFHYPVWICVSTQVGCAVGCGFCRSGSKGLKRNLTYKEIMDQIKLSIIFAVKKFNYSLMFINVSFTGMGEPLHNIDNVRTTIDTIQANCKNSLINLTTTGNLSSLEKLTDLQYPISLDISMHFLREELRQKYIPAEYRNPLKKTIQYVLENKEKFKDVTFDYLLFKNINDTDEDLNILVSTFNGREVAIELKKYNRAGEYDIFEPSTSSVFEKFYETLENHNIICYVEESEGQKIGAGCGQLVWEYEKV